MRVSPRLRLQVGVFAVIAAILFIVTYVIPATGAFDTSEPAEQGETQQGTVTRVLDEQVEQGPAGDIVHRTLEVRVGDRTVTVEQSYTEEDAMALDVDPGDKVLLQVSEGPEGETYFIAGFVRTTPLILLAVAFAGLVLLVGRWRGLTSLLGLGASLLVIVRFILPGILSGADPVLISVIGALVIMLTTLYLAHGVTAKTSVALLGTVIALLLTAALAQISISVTKLSGLADESAVTLQILSAGDIDAGGLLLAGIIIGALGVLDDVTVAQASTVFELHHANPLLGARELYQRAMNVGRDHIASTVNTLVLAYAGAALPLLALLALLTEPLDSLLNREFLSTEIVRTLVGSMGIVAAVPLTTALAAIVAGGGFFRTPLSASITRAPVEGSEEEREA
ncbi:MAG: YibE/F family protein [Dehalococcoidia bacterium]